MKTKQNISDALNYEDVDTPEAIAAVMQQEDGKKLTVRLLDKLPGGRDRWYIKREFGMTHLCERSRAKRRFRFLLAHTDGPTEIDSRQLRELNPCYFAAAVARNKKRMVIKNNADELQAIANSVNRLDQAVDTIAREYEYLVNKVDGYKLMRLTGCDKIQQMAFLRYDRKGEE